MKFTLDYLKSLGRKPTVDRDGVIQLDVEPNIMRLNVWPEEPLPGHRVHPIHSHGHDIRTLVVHGSLTNDVYYFDPAPDYGKYVLHVVRADELVPLRRNYFDQPVVSRGYMTLVSSATIRPGQSFTLSRNAFHDPVPHGLTATLTTLEKPGKLWEPMVAVPSDVRPTNDFPEYDEGMLWDAISRVL